MVDYFCAELVLTRGPETLQRRISLQVPVDGTVVTVGRGLENNVVFGANLLFASQRHCQLFIRPAKDTLRSELQGAEVEEEAAMLKDGEEQVSLCGKRRRSDPECGRCVSQLELCLVDMGSSNGTFINGVRIMEGVITPLHHGDEVIFGGMCDIKAGTLMPMKAVINRPEIVTWRVLFDTNDVDYEYVATPSIVLCADFIGAAEKRMALELLQGITTSPLPASREFTLTMTSSPPTVPKRLAHQQEYDEETDRELKTSTARGVPQDEKEKTILFETMDELQRRSGSVTAPLVLRGKSDEMKTISLFTLRAVRVGGHSFIMPRTTAKLAGQRGRRGGSKHKKSDHLPHIYTLSLTETHWKWAMDNDACGIMKGSKRCSVVETALLWSSAERIMYCTPQCGLTVVVSDLTHLIPCVKPHNEAVEETTSFITWMVGEELKENEENKETTGVSSFQQLLDDIHRHCAMHEGLPEPQPLDETEFLSRYAPSL